MVPPRRSKGISPGASEPARAVPGRKEDRLFRSGAVSEISRPAVFQVLDPGVSATLQDLGRPGWRRFGVPRSGAMDDHAALWANRLLNNPPDAPVLELLLHGARLTVLQDSWITVTGADAEASVPMWRTVLVNQGDTIHFRRHRSGLWTYLAVEGGFDAPRLLGSASVFARGGLGRALAKGDRLLRSAAGEFQLKAGIAGRFVGSHERRDYESPPPLRVWRGPQWEEFNASDQDRFFSQAWTVTAQSDRVGYRLSGIRLTFVTTQMTSEPVRVGSIQIPESGLPIVIMRDGPTVGGYPKLGLIDPAALSWLAQCPPGQNIRFQPIH